MILKIKSVVGNEYIVNMDHVAYVIQNGRRTCTLNFSDRNERMVLETAYTLDEFYRIISAADQERVLTGFRVMTDVARSHVIENLDNPQ